ncbi:hypothetical protein [Paludibaculum fermentans]|uniref:PilZ domain-containing protein n=1 Tax=Paludibaculum fermentans TaxID=1473598 RepID=A0A7S7NV33_PALFE|nr:hypothetical protein [Paludibaculum fermentans]QOY90365.1 hypothetical protein IRI77_10535 [Paludibaculum fermentans]
MHSEPADRYLCSKLVSIQLPAAGGAERVIDGNLEEISPCGAYLNVEEPIHTQLSMRFSCSDNQGQHEFAGVVTGSSRDPDTGYYIEMQFHPGTTWSPAAFHPNHMIRASAVLGLAPAEAAPPAVGCDRGVCPKEVLSELLEPQTPLSGRVRAAARKVASLCGAMSDKEAAGCFSTLFGAGPECRLFAEFKESYTQGRKRDSRPHHRTLRTQFKGMMQLANAIAPEVVRSKGCAESRSTFTSIRLSGK